MRKPWWIVVLVASLLTTGCLGSVSPARIDQGTLDDKGWRETDTTEESVAMGLGQIVTKDYRQRGGQEGTGAIVATTNDVPILDESRFIPDAIEQIEQQRNIQLERSGETTVSLPTLGVDEINAQLYTFQKSGASGKAILFTPDQCSDFVVTVGYGITGAAGISGIEKTYNEAKDIARNVVCG